MHTITIVFHVMSTVSNPGYIVYNIYEKPYYPYYIVTHPHTHNDYWKPIVHVNKCTFVHEQI